MKIEDNHKDDLKWLDTKADPNFVARRNKDVIDGIIKKHKANILRKRKDYAEQIAERSDAVVSFLRYVDRGGESKIDKYLGRKLLMELQGKKIVQKLVNARKGQMMLHEN